MNWFDVIEDYDDSDDDSDEDEDNCNPSPHDLHRHCPYQVCISQPRRDLPLHKQDICTARHLPNIFGGCLHYLYHEQAESFPLSQLPNIFGDNFCHNGYFLFKS